MKAFRFIAFLSGCASLLISLRLVLEIIVFEPVLLLAMMPCVVYSIVDQMGRVVNG